MSNIHELVQTLQAAGGQMFQVTFTKRSTGEERRVVGRFGVTKDLKGGSLKYNPAEKGLVIMWINPECRRNDGKDNGYRAIPVDAISEIRAHGRTFTVRDGMAIEVA